jgi:hypothetical protein
VEELLLGAAVQGVPAGVAVRASSSLKRISFASSPTSPGRSSLNFEGFETAVFAAAGHWFILS